MFKKISCMILILSCLLLSCQHSFAEPELKEYSFGPWRYSVWRGWHYDESEETAHVHTRDRNNPDAGQISVVCVSNSLLSLASVPTVFDFFINFDELYYSTLVHSIAAGSGGRLEESSMEKYDNGHVSGMVFRMDLEQEGLHYAGFVTYHDDTFFVMLYRDSRKKPDRLLTKMKELLLPTIYIEE